MWLLNCCVVIELTKRKNLVGKKSSDGGANDDDATEQCQEEESGSAFDITRALQWKHTTVAVQMTLALTGTHSNALLTISLLTNRYIFTVHLYTVHIKKLCCIC